MMGYLFISTSLPLLAKEIEKHIYSLAPSLLLLTHTPFRKLVILFY